ncbi:hypothetical protein L210DRAFT_3576079 [Boletus edulis BED1]|uniref:Uncharacterized protein n=1 Tax=Boletus edulis BED1 TaxID=1328754 RepID=A0AAD4BDA5_BOLED|nr:hypothetical protein L210DRAFT_3576079 [Boletus edulis BED1]
MVARVISTRPALTLLTVLVRFSPRTESPLLGDDEYKFECNVPGISSCYPSHLFPCDCKSTTWIVYHMKKHRDGSIADVPDLPRP